MTSTTPARGWYVENDCGIIGFHKTDADAALVRIWNTVTNQGIACYGTESPLFFDEHWAEFVPAEIMREQVMESAYDADIATFPKFDAWALKHPESAREWRTVIALYTNFYVSSGDVSVVTGINRGEILRNFLDWGIPPYEPPMTDQEIEVFMAGMRAHMADVLGANEEVREQLDNRGNGVNRDTYS